MDIRVDGKKSIRGGISVPGDKSISHRAAIIGSIAEGITEIDGFAGGYDCLSTLDCLKRLGVCIERKGDIVRIKGRGLYLKRPSEVICAGNSGTTARLLSGVLAGQAFDCVIDGDASLRKRPMSRVIHPLSLMGARIASDSGRLPMNIAGGSLHAIKYEMPVSSAQVKSAILLAGLYADGPTMVTGPFGSRDHTELMLPCFGAKLQCSDNGAVVYPAQRLEGQRVPVPGDISSAAFFIVAALLLPESEIYIRNVGLNETRTGILDVLKAMGGDIRIYGGKYLGREAAGDVAAKSSALKATSIGADMIPRLIDEIPVLAVAACFAEGTTFIRGAGELKVKESDRIRTVAQELNKIGARIEKLNDGFAITGVDRLHGVAVDSHNDHRLAMALAVAGLAADGCTTIRNGGCSDISFPGFYDELNAACV